MDDFLVRALVAGLGIAVATGPFGCFVVWRHMAYFGDSLAHGALLGVVLGLVLGISPMIGVVVFSVAVAVLLALSQSSSHMGADTVLGIMAHAGLALGLVLLSLYGGGGFNLMGWLLGDILAVSWADVAMIWGGAVVVVPCLALVWRTLLLASLDAGLAQVEGHDCARARLVLMVLMALVVAAGMKLVGILLVTALLIIPAAAARPFARSPESMAVVAVGVGMVSVVLGLAGSWHFDTPSGPSMVVAALGMFLLSRGKRA